MAAEPISILLGGDDDDDDDANDGDTDSNSNKGGEADREIILIWKVAAFLARPRLRLPAPAIAFKLSGSLAAARTTAATDDPPLPRRVPQPANLLAPLAHDPALHGTPPYFSAQRLLRDGGSGGPQSTAPAAYPLRVASRRPTRAIPALGARVRFHRAPAPGAAAGSALTAALELDVPAFAPHPVEVTHIQLALHEGAAEALGGADVMQLPLRCHARDHVVGLYRLAPHHWAQSREPRALDVRVRARVLLAARCAPRIDVRWTASVDFAPAASVPGGIGAQRGSYPPHGTRASAGAAETEGGAAASPGVALSIEIKHAGPDVIRVGAPFRWTVFVINRSSKTRRLAFVAIPPRRPGHGRPASAGRTSVAGAEAVAPAVVDDNVLRATARGRAGGAELLQLDADAQVGYELSRSHGFAAGWVY